jgi:hypothetical protein
MWNGCLNGCLSRMSDYLRILLPEITILLYHYNAPEEVLYHGTHIPFQNGQMIDWWFYEREK